MSDFKAEVLALLSDHAAIVEKVLALPDTISSDVESAVAKVVAEGKAELAAMEAQFEAEKSAVVDALKSGLGPLTEGLAALFAKRDPLASVAVVAAIDPVASPIVAGQVDAAPDASPVL